MPKYPSLLNTVPEASQLTTNQRFRTGETDYNYALVSRHQFVLYLLNLLQHSRSDWSNNYIPLEQSFLVIQVASQTLILFHSHHNSLKVAILAMGVCILKVTWHLQHVSLLSTMGNECNWCIFLWSSIIYPSSSRLCFRGWLERVPCKIIWCHALILSLLTPIVRLYTPERRSAKWYLRV